MADVVRATASHNSTSAAVDRREWKRGQRRVLVQCEKCHCNGSGTVNHRGRVVSVNLRAEYRQGWLHMNCGGLLVAFDIEAGE